jgi:hypothetical protein
MRKATLIALASTFVAASASVAFADPQDRPANYNPVNQVYQREPGFTSVAAAPHVRHQTARSVEQLQRLSAQDPWTKAREDDALEAGHGS